ncbi:MAG: hypothetical protein LBG87_03470 [Spirochaetaceae bacterium]|jgi:electron transport complex protein RnfA|nr:hypothetical protein [Spirochaetaceae bacterium]
MSGLISLFVCAGFSFNLLLHFALGIQGIAEEQERSRPLPLLQGGILFAAVLSLWGICSYLLYPLSFGLLEYVLLFPLSAGACIGLEALAVQFMPETVPGPQCFNPDSGYNGLVPTALGLTLHIAGTPLEALVLSLSFAAGVLLVMVLLRYIRKRSALEPVPRHLRGRPILLISMGLLSLVFTSLTVIFFAILGIF